MGMKTTAAATYTTIRKMTRDYEDYDDCLLAAAMDVASDLGVEEWRVEAEWEDEYDRSVILVVVS